MFRLQNYLRGIDCVVLTPIKAAKNFIVCRPVCFSMSANKNWMLYNAFYHFFDIVSLLSLGINKEHLKEFSSRKTKVVIARHSNNLSNESKNT